MKGIGWQRGVVIFFLVFQRQFVESSIG